MISIKTYPLDILEQSNLSKGELISKLKLENTFDFALPQIWLDDFVKQSKLDYDVVLSTTVWLYFDRNNLPVSACTEVMKAIEKFFYKYPIDYSCQGEKIKKRIWAIDRTISIWQYMFDNKIAYKSDAIISMEPWRSYSHNCPLCEVYLEGNCIDCPWPKYDSDIKEERNGKMFCCYGQSPYYAYAEKIESVYPMYDRIMYDRIKVDDADLKYIEDVLNLIKTFNKGI